MAKNEALEAARALAQNPSLASVMRNARLPVDIGVLLRFLAGEDSSDLLGRSDSARLQDMIERYVLAVMLYPGAAPERVLGVGAGASRDQMRAHMRCLMNWLHPDRGADAWRAAYSARVLEAWRTLSVAVPRIEAPASTERSRNRRPQTMQLKLNWVPRPVVRENPRRKAIVLAAPALLVLLIAVIAVFDNPVRQWAEAALATRLSSEMRFGAGTGL